MNLMIVPAISVCISFLLSVCMFTVPKVLLISSATYICLACLTVFVNCLVKQFAMCLGVVAILLLNIMEVFIVCGGALLDRPCMVFQRMCVVCL